MGCPVFLLRGVDAPPLRTKTAVRGTPVVHSPGEAPGHLTTVLVHVAPMRPLVVLLGVAPSHAEIVTRTTARQQNTAMLAQQV